MDTIGKGRGTLRSFDQQKLDADQQSVGDHRDDGDADFLNSSPREGLMMEGSLYFYCNHNVRQMQEFLCFFITPR
jgi:hypothetical protein